MRFEAGGEEEPERLAGMTAGEVEHERERLLANLLADPAADLDEAQAQGFELQARHPRLVQEPTQRVEQSVCGGVEQQAELVGPEAMAAEAIGETGVCEVLDP